MARATMASRLPRLGFFSLATLLVTSWAVEFGGRYALRAAAAQYDAAVIQKLTLVSIAIDVVLGMGFVAALLALCLTPRSTRVVVLAQIAATLAALAVLMRGGAILLLVSGAFSAGEDLATFTQVGTAAVTLVDALGSALLLVVLSRVARAARAPGARWLALGGLLLVVGRMAVIGVSFGLGDDAATRAVLEQVQSWAYLAYALLTLGLCVRAGILVTRIPDEQESGAY
jgi:hypothetical protein